MSLSADILLAEDEDIADQTARILIEAHRDALPDLSAACIITPHQNLSAHCRQRLLERLPAEQAAVIPPFIGTLRHWISDTVPLPDNGVRMLPDQARRLLFIEALEENPGLFREENKWQVSSALMHLFDELALNEIGVLDQDSSGWQQTLGNAYSCDAANQHLQREAVLVQTLWQAWQRQLRASGLIDGTTAYVERLRLARTQDMGRHLYLIAPGQLTRCEKHVIATLVEQGRCTIVDYAGGRGATAGPARTAASAFIEAAFDYGTAPLQQRARMYGQAQPQGLPFSIFYSGDAETEARAVDLQVRQWLLQGKRNVGIVSEDRKLSRRVRALLERAGISVQDLAGWSLATTSAAAALERWLQCIEEDFDYRPMLDLVKSHFFRSGPNADEQLETVFRLENDIILHENISHGIPRYRKQLEYRLHRLQNWPSSTYANIVQLLDQLEKAAHFLQQLYRSTRAFPADRFLDALDASLQQLGMAASFEDDAAGLQILNALDDMRTALLQSSTEMHWSDFRTWLAMTLEQELFIPQTGSSPVRMMSLAQSDCQHFDALVLAAADRQHLPGKPEASPFFNQSVRQSLGLPDWQEQHEARLQQFKRLLQAAETVLITCKHEENGEPVPLSPWIETLNAFHSLTHDEPLENRELQQLLDQDVEVFICDTHSLPTEPQRPEPSLPAESIPDRMSASAHQRLIDCPYKFFAGDGIHLKPPDEIREELQKSDYGERVHTILNAFHSPVQNLPAPFGEPLSDSNRQRAKDHLETISEAVFKQDMEDNALHRSWLHRWKQHTAAYIDWQIEQQQHWAVSETEKRCEARLNDIGLTLYGRLDRIDTDPDNDDHRAIIDYKTGKAASQADIDSGEDVQLATYALLAGDTSSVKYLSLDEANGSVRTGSSLEGEDLRSLTHDVRERLQTLVDMQREGRPMPAWGDDRTCSYCDFIGLCRRKVWSQAK